MQVMLVCCSLLSVRLARSAAALQHRPATAGRRAGPRRTGAGSVSATRFDDAVVPVLAAEPHVALDGQRLEALRAERTSVTSKVPPPRS